MSDVGIEGVVPFFQDQPGIKLDIEGVVPVQATGQYGEYPFYFRARYEHWQIRVFPPGTNIDVHPWPEPIHFAEEQITDDPFAAGWISHLEALMLIAAALTAWQAEKALKIAESLQEPEP
jgi:hypothetical protein